MKDVVFIAATNRPDLLDPGLMRPGRIDKVVRVSAPDRETRLSILKVHSKKVPLDKEISLEEIAEVTEGYSGADLEGIIKEAALMALQESNLKADVVKKKHVEAALAKLVPSISKETKEAYGEFRKQMTEFKPTYVR